MDRLARVLRTRVVLPLVVGGLFLVIVVALGLCGISTNASTASDDGAPSGQSAGPTPLSEPVTTPNRAFEIPATKDPESFARSVAEALFAWDTASGLMPVDHTAMILRFGDPTGTERAGLASDIANYLPSRQAWIELRKYATRQQLSVQRSYVPDTWTAAANAAPPGQLQEGTTAITIEGNRHRDGVWGTEAVTSSRSVAFTVFVVCGPTYDKCHLLRLSQPDLFLR